MMPDVDITSPWETPEVGKAPDMFSYFKQLCAWLHEQDADAQQYRTIAIDTLSELQDHLMIEHMEKKRKGGQSPEWKDQNEVKNQVVFIVRQLRTLSQRRGVNIILTTHMQEDSDPKPMPWKKRPALTPSIRRGVLASLDIVGMIEIDEKTRKRRLIIEERANTETKTREPYNWPRKLPGVIENPSMVDILEYIYGDGKLTLLEPTSTPTETESEE